MMNIKDITFRKVQPSLKINGRLTWTMNIFKTHMSSCQRGGFSIQIGLCQFLDLVGGLVLESKWHRILCLLPLPVFYGLTTSPTAMLTDRKFPFIHSIPGTCLLLVPPPLKLHLTSEPSISTDYRTGMGVNNYRRERYYGPCTFTLSKQYFISSMMYAAVYDPLSLVSTQSRWPSV